MKTPTTKKALAHAWLALHTYAAVLAEYKRDYPFGLDAEKTVDAALAKILGKQPVSAEVWEMLLDGKVAQ